ncbi:permease [Halalkalibacillus halophilus]|uniref:permease n=1 Tax=Halalkalibacillus halophilus TaxID=392827 RepID=UPI0004286D0A|nr:permease [Halalkalibacillus halophilus]
MKRFFREGAIYALLFLIVFVFLFAEFINLDERLTISSRVLDFNTIFLSIFLEAIPFVLLGVFVSSIIQVFVSDETIKKYIPKNPIGALLPAVIAGAIFPICECAIVPIVRRLIQKGMKLHVAMVILVSAPILNPIVFLSTFYAFQTNMVIVWGRMGLAFLIAMLVGLVIYMLFRNRLNPLRSEFGAITSESSKDLPMKQKIKDIFYHASDEFFTMGKFLLIGAMFASFIQTFLPRELLVGFGMDPILGPAVMMVLAYFLSLCSEADAFVAASLNQIFSPSAILAFLVYGPMMDLKNTLLMLAYFKTKFVLTLIAVVTAIVFPTILLFQAFWY